MLGGDGVSFNNLVDLYKVDRSHVSFEHVKSKELLPFANNIEKFRLEIQKKYDQDEELFEVLNLLKTIFFRLASSISPYNQVINEGIRTQLNDRFRRVKSSYPDLFKNVLTPIGISYKQVMEAPANYLYEHLFTLINKKAVVGLKIALITKRALSSDEKDMLNSEIKTYVKMKYYTENSFRKDNETFDEVIYLGNPNYFHDFVKNTFKGKSITFISYDIFPNSIHPKIVFADIDQIGVHSTIFLQVTFDEAKTNKTEMTNDEKESIISAVNKVLEQQRNQQGTQDLVEACIVYLENERFLFAPKDSKIRIFAPNEKEDFINQKSFKDVEEDEYIVIRNERDTKLIAEIADTDILKRNAEKYRNMQHEWKRKLRYNVEKKGLKKVSDILMKKHKIKTASMASVRSWCNEDSIYPRELDKILKVFKYDSKEIKTICEVMRKIQNAHRTAGRLISRKLMNEISNSIVKELQEKGFYTFESKEFNGASFNIERVVSIDRSTHLMGQHNLMKPMSIYD